MAQSGAGPAEQHDSDGISIGAVLKALEPDFPDLTISKIRFLETEGLISPERRFSGYRLFSKGDVARLRFILTAQRERSWPLKVIKDALDRLDRGLDEPGPTAPAEELELVMTVLEHGGYKRLPKPLTVAGVEFDFEAAARGTRRSHDLVLVTTDRLPVLRLQRLLAGLTRSLDLAQSRRPVTLVVVGAQTAKARSELERHARVLHVESADPSQEEVERALAVLLPLDLPAAVIMHGGDPVNEVLATLGPGPDTTDHIALVRAAMGGADAVREALRDYVNAGIVTTSPGGVLND